MVLETHVSMHIQHLEVELAYKLISMRNLQTVAMIHYRRYQDR
jgi:hypothetical protein